ncbi:GNAT family N-acetyltransferase [Streptomyces polyrhachis]|uniref:GNAT family N-acetyltransferase n=1 Tax=Streptomyces polyrhachis TaxID=1282885 RepID=A0ABW2GC98_9ACTN
MTRNRQHPKPHTWRRDVVELAALFTAVAVADTVAKSVAHAPEGPVMLVASAVVLLVTAGLHTWWARRHTHAPPPPSVPAGTDGSLGAGADSSAGGSAGGSTDSAPRAEPALWRMRTTVQDRPGALAAVCGALAHHGVDILSLQTHPLADGAVDEFLLRAPAEVTPGALSAAVADGGGRDTWLERADAHDLVDVPTRMLALAARTATDAAELPLALRQLLGRCTLTSTPADGRGPAVGPPAEGELDDTVLRLPDPAGGWITVERPYLPFTPTEFARARALVELDARLGPRMPQGRTRTTLPEGEAVTVRRAGPADLPAAREMHARCSAATISQRYHGALPDADRYLGHLLSPRFGRSLAVESASGRLVALGHLLWDGEEAEVALLVEDGWQGRGVGSELLRHLVELAQESGYREVYAVTRSSNSAMVAAMRSLALPLDYQIEEGTMVLTARLERRPALRR